jgi:hypothetical protein
MLEQHISPVCPASINVPRQFEFQVDVNAQWTMYSISNDIFSATNAVGIPNVRRPIMGPDFIQSVYLFGKE